MSDGILLAIKPKYAEAILAGEKSVELRRVCPRVEAGSIVILYGSSPVKAVLGAVRVERIVETTPEDLWPMVEDTAGVSREEFDAYYRGASRGVGIFLHSAQTAHGQVQLEHLREVCPRFRPPQGYRYLKGMCERLRSLLLSVVRTGPGDNVSDAA